MDVESELNALSDTITCHKHQQNRNYEFANICYCLESDINDYQCELDDCFDYDREREINANILHINQLLSGIKARFPVEFMYYKSNPDMLNENSDASDASYDSYDNI
jgi:hypothetical protein